MHSELPINFVRVIGNLGGDAEMRYTPNGTPVTTFRMAHNHGKDERQRTLWITVVCFGELAEESSRIPKGTRVVVEGRLEDDSWVKDGIRRFSFRIVATAIEVRKYSDNGGPTATGASDDDDAPF